MFWFKYLFGLLMIIPICSGCEKRSDTERLFEAAAYGDLITIEKLLDRGVDINARDNQGKSVLHVSGSISIKLLISRGADIDAKDNYGQTPLYIAAHGSCNITSELLIRQGADIHVRNNNGNTVLHAAAHSGILSTIRLLLNRGADINAVNNDGKTPIYEAINQNRVEAVHLLITRGALANAERTIDLLEAALIPTKENAVLYFKDEIIGLLVRSADVHAKDQYGQTLLIQALQRCPGHYFERIIPMLVEAGADINTKNNLAWTPLDFAYAPIEKDGILMEIPKDQELVDFLVSKGAKRGAGHRPPQEIEKPKEEDFFALVKKVVAEGGDINKPLGGYPYAPLVSALCESFFKAAIFLIENSADVNVRKHDDEMTPLHLAVFRKQKDIVELLISHGAELEARDEKRKMTPLEYAVVFGEDTHLKIVQVLIANGAKLPANGLHHAALSGNAKLMKILLRTGMKVDFQNDLGQTPLHLAAQEGHRETALLLLQHGADVNVRDCMGLTPLVYANGGDPKTQDVANLLKEYGGKTFGWRKE
jgi:ankyrin repeat protein